MVLRYIELKTGYNDDGPAWIAHVELSRSMRTVYFNGRALLRVRHDFRGHDSIDFNSTSQLPRVKSLYRLRSEILNCLYSVYRISETINWAPSQKKDFK